MDSCSHRRIGRARHVAHAGLGSAFPVTSMPVVMTACCGPAARLPRLKSTCTWQVNTRPHRRELTDADKWRIGSRCGRFESRRVATARSDLGPVLLSTSIPAILIFRDVRADQSRKVESAGANSVVCHCVRCGGTLDQASTAPLSVTTATTGIALPGQGRLGLRDLAGASCSYGSYPLCQAAWFYLPSCQSLPMERLHAYDIPITGHFFRPRCDAVRGVAVRPVMRTVPKRERQNDGQ